MAKIENVEQYIETHSKWKGQLLQLRELLLSCGLAEGIKWGSPVYMKGGQNLLRSTIKEKQ
jgi:uncharacterized protein YdeI (YjbR/CyaY-like superfamily)